MSDEFFRRAGPQLAEPPHTPDPAFAARPRLIQLRDALTRAVKQLSRARWNEPAVFFFEPKRQRELEAARPAPTDRFAAIADRVAAEMPSLLAHVEVRRIARVLDGLKPAALAMAPHCGAVNDLVDLLAVPDDEVFLVLTPHDRTGVRLHVRGAASVAQLQRLLEEQESTPPAPLPEGKGVGGVGSSPFQLFVPTALTDGTLPTGFAGCEYWLRPPQPLAMVPRLNGERVVLLGPAVVRHALDAEPRFPTMAVESELIQTLNPFQVMEALSRLSGRPVPVAVPTAPQTVARAA